MKVTLLTENTRVRYTGDGVLKEFSYPFNPIDLSYVKVYKNLQPVTAPDVTISSGVVTFNTAPAEGDSIVIIREKPLTYDSGIVSKGIISPDSLDNLAVELLGQIQQVNEKLDRVPVYPIDTAMTGEDIINEFNQNVSDVRDAKISIEGKVEEINTIVSSGLTEITEATSEGKTQITEEKNAAINAVETSTAPLIERAETAATEAEASRANAEEWAKSVDAENIVHRTGDEEVGGNKTFIGNNIFTGTNDFKGPTSPIRIDRNGANFVEVTTLDNNVRTGGFRNIKETNNVNSTIMYVSSEDGTSIKGSMGISYDGSSAYTYAPTPATSDNSTKIANTEYTNNFINSIRTNCITAIPQDIKLELNNGTLTLKAGSKVYKPDGSIVNIDSDKTTTGANTTKAIAFYDIESNFLAWRHREECYSQNTAPTYTQYMLWYDTTNKIVKATADTGATWTECALPVCEFTANSTQITSIDQIFNGFGYIGSHWYELKGNEGKARNGRNTDGSLNNYTKTAANVVIHACGRRTGEWFLMSGFDGNFRNAYKDTYFVQDEMPSISSSDSYAVWESPRENITRVTSDKGVTWTKVLLVNCGEYSTADGRITSFNPKTVFQAADYQDTVRINDDQAITGRKTFTETPICNKELWLVDTTGEAPDNPSSKDSAYGTLRWIVKGTRGSTAWYGGGQELWRIQPIINSLGRFRVVATYQYGTSKPALFNFGCNADGSNPYFRTITPATTDNSTSAATTAWVNKFITNLSSTVGSGYMYIGNLLVQWGTSGRLSNTSKYITYPKPFANTSYSLFVSGKADDSETALGKIPTIGRTLKTTGFTMNTNGWTEQYHSYIGYWLAIGKRG